MTARLDSAVAASVTSAPIWFEWLSQLNIILASLSLLFGILLALTRLWIFAESRGWICAKRQTETEKPPPKQKSAPQEATAPPAADETMFY